MPQHGTAIRGPRHITLDVDPTALKTPGVLAAEHRNVGMFSPDPASGPTRQGLHRSSLSTVFRSEMPSARCNPASCHTLVVGLCTWRSEVTQPATGWPTRRDCRPSPSRRRTLPETRDRAGTLMSAAAVAGGLAAGLAFSADRVGGIDEVGAVGAVLAVVGFVGVVVTTMMIWRPTEGRFVHDAGVIVGSYLEGEPPLELPEIHRELALWLGKQTESNRRMLRVDRKVRHAPARGPTEDVQCGTCLPARGDRGSYPRVRRRRQWLRIGRLKRSKRRRHRSRRVPIRACPRSVAQRSLPSVDSRSGACRPITGEAGRASLPRRWRTSRSHAVTSQLLTLSTSPTAAWSRDDVSRRWS